MVTRVWSLLTFKQARQTILDPWKFLFYRYFENKQKLLLYLIGHVKLGWFGVINCFFCYGQYRFSQAKLEEAINVLTHPIVPSDNSFAHINEILFGKDYYIGICKGLPYKQNVDSANEMGYFKVYKRMFKRVSEWYCKFNPKFEFPHNANFPTA